MARVTRGEIITESKPQRISRGEIKPTFSWEKATKEFILFQQANGKANRTIEDYEYHINLFFKTTGIEDDDFSIDGLITGVRVYFAALNQKIQGDEASPYTFNMRRKKLLTFFRWLVKEGKLPSNPLEGIKKMKEDEIPRAVEPETVLQLLKQPNQKTFVGLRDYAMMLLEMDTGIRPGESTQLKVNDFNLAGREVIVPARVAKTRIARTLPLKQMTAQAIEKLIEYRHPSWGNDVPVLCSEDGSILQKRGWCHRYEKYSRAIGKQVTPYNLRHTCISFLLCFFG